MNPLGESVEFTNTKPYIFTSISGVGATTGTVVSDQAATLHGKIYRGEVLGDREINLTYHVHGEDKKSAYKLHMELLKVCSSMLCTDGEEGTFYYENDYGKWWIPAAVKIAPSRDTMIGNQYIKGIVTFYCADPFWRSQIPCTEKLAMLGGGLQFPLTIDSETGIQFGSKNNSADCINEGDAKTPLSIRIMGPAKEPCLTNRTTGEFIKVNKSIEEGATLEINTDLKDISVNIISNGIAQDAIGYVSLDSTMFQLRPGTNKLEYTSADEDAKTQIYLEFYSRYGGV